MKKGIVISAMLLGIIAYPSDRCIAEMQQVQADHRVSGIEEAKKIVVAKVNGTGITMDAVVNMMNRISSKQGAQKDSGQEGIEMVRAEALRRLIFQELAVQSAASSGLKVNKANVEQALTNLKLNLGGDEGYRKFLEHEKTSEQELMSKVERSLLLELVFAREVYDKVVVPEEELRREYEKEKERYKQQEKVFATDVVFFLKPDDPGSVAKAEAVLEKIKADANSDPWSLVLDGSFIVRNIELKKERDGQVYEAAIKMKKDELSGVIRSDDSLRIIRLREYTPERYFTVDEAKGSLEGRLRYAAQQDRVKQWEDDLRRSANIEILMP